MKLSLLTRCSAIAALVAVAAVSAAETRWQQLGSRKITDRIDHDSIAVGAAEGELSALIVRVKGVAVQFRSMTVRYANGDQQMVELREVVRAGGQSRVIDLVGSERIVRSVVFVYDDQSLRGRRATVRLFGRR